MRLGPTLLGALVTTAAVVAAAASGCVSNNDTTSPGVDSGQFVLGDTGAPPGQDGSPPPPADAGTDATVTPPPADDAGSDATPGPDAADAGNATDAADAALPQAGVRFANLTSEWGTVGDLCISPHGANAWQGPILAGAGLAGGLTELSVSQYFPVAAGQNDVRLLPAGATTCATDAGTSGDLTNLPAVPSGLIATVVLADPLPGEDAGAEPRVAVLVDEAATTGSNASLRLANFSSFMGNPVSLSLGSGVAAVPFFQNVTTAQVIDPGADALGYRQQAGLTAIDLGFTGGSTSIEIPPVTLSAGSIATTFVTDMDDDGIEYALVYCPDGPLAPTSGGLTTCQVVTEQDGSDLNSTRFANFLADTTAPSTDVCVKYHQLPAFVGPLLGGPADAGTGLSLNPTTSNGGSSTAVSGYFEMGGGVAFDVRIVAGGSTDCSTGLIPDYLYTPTAGDFETLAVTGYVTVPGGAPEPTQYDAGPPEDGGAVGLASVAATLVPFVDDPFLGGDTGVRFIHLAAANPQPFEVAASGFSYTDVPYGAYGTLPGPVNEFGYLDLPSVTGGGGLQITDTIGGAFEQDLAYGMSSGDVDTFFLFAAGASKPFLVVVQCPDNSYQYGGVLSCSSLGGG